MGVPVCVAALQDSHLVSPIEFFERFGIDTTVGERPDAAEVNGSVHSVLFPQAEGIDVKWVDGNPVIPLDDAASQMMQTRTAYEPALEMIAASTTWTSTRVIAM